MVQTSIKSPDKSLSCWSFNRRTQYSSFEAQLVSGALGAEISGIDISKRLSEKVVADLRQALLDHLVIFFRDQNLGPAQQIAFSRRFGELDEHDFVKGMEGYPELIRLVREADEEGMNFGGVWHSDVTHMECPALGSVLYALDVPPFGGDTLFSNQYLAYETLSPGMKEMLDGLTAIHSAEGPFGPRGRSKTNWKNMQVETSEKALIEVEHPVVRTHPETGRKGLFVNGTFTLRFKGWSGAESEPLLKFLFRHASLEAFTCRFHWQRGSVAFWDNRSLMHFALNDYNGYRREMLRSTIAGDRPY